MADDKTWKPLDLIKVSADYLAGKDVPGPRLDAEVLLCATLGLARRVDLYANFERTVSGKELTSYRELIRRRAQREPVSRILGHREFMGLDFKVTPDVLSPRPETELLVEAAIECVNPKKNTLPSEEAVADMAQPDTEEAGDEAMSAELAQLLDSYAEDVDDDSDLERDGITLSRPAARSAAAPKKTATGRKPKQEKSRVSVAILDLGTGSGCIAVSLAAHLPAARVTAVDASPKALSVAKKNAQQAGVAERVDFRQGDWFAGCRDGEKFDVILSNPPYLVDGDPEIWPEVSQYDPPAALYGGKDGLDCYRRIIPDAPEWLTPDGWLFFEVGAEQARRVADMLTRRGFRDVDVLADYGGVERVVKGQAPLL